MKQYEQKNLLPIEKLIVASRKDSSNIYTTNSSGSDRDAATRRQKKHELLLTFMANTKHQKPRPAARRGLLKSLLSFFL